MFDEFIAKGGEIVHKVGRTLANQVDERRNMIMSIYGGACIENVRGSLIQGEFLSLSLPCLISFGFELFLALICHFASFTIFHAFVGLAVFPPSR
jgi:hypothetical protein